MEALNMILWLEKIEKDMIASCEFCKPDLYSKESWWRKTHEKAMSELSDEEIAQYNKLHT